VDVEFEPSEVRLVLKAVLDHIQESADDDLEGEGGDNHDGEGEGNSPDIDLASADRRGDRRANPRARPGG
jgi:hypothetical protein